MGTFQKLGGSGAFSVFVAADPFGYQSANKARTNENLLALGIFGRDKFAGGSELAAFGVGSGTGWLTAFDAVILIIDNTGTQASGSSGRVYQARGMVRVGNAGITMTPRVYNLTDSSVPTQSGALACAGIASDFSGTNQQQTIAFTPASGVKGYVIQGQKSADTDLAWLARWAWDGYIP